MMHACPDALLESKILLVDDEPMILKSLELAMRRVGYTRVKSTTHPREAVLLFLEFRPDVVVLDLAMPKMDGCEVMEELAPYMEEAGFPPVLMITGQADDANRKRCLARGARDLLSKPLDPAEITLRVRNLLETHWLYTTARTRNEVLERCVIDRTIELEHAQYEILARLAKTAEFRDDDTGEHTQRVGATAREIALALGLSAHEADLLQHAAPLHDVGKIAIPDSVLLKPGKLTAEEFELVKAHASTGAKLLSGSRFPLLQMAETIARHHHENWDGTGYPDGLKRDDIPLAARITSVADVFDALTHDRPYKKGWSKDEAVAEIVRQTQRKFDPRVVDGFMRWLEGSLDKAS
ncbi:MAG: response regulator [Deltaproteobacteria bacterium]|nr:response regulator [Deltaproteobacteria bacterium]